MKLGQSAQQWLKWKYGFVKAFLRFNPLVIIMIIIQFTEFAIKKIISLCLSQVQVKFH